MTCNRCEWQFCSAHYQISRTLRSSSEKPLKFLNLIWLLLVSALWFKQEFIGDKIKIQWIVLGSWTRFLLIALFQLHRPVCLEFAACKSVKSTHSVWVQSPAQDFPVETGLFANYRQTLPMSSGAVYNYNVREGCVLVYCVFVLQKDVRCLLELSIVMHIISVAYYCCCCYYYYCCSPSYGPSKQ